MAHATAQFFGSPPPGALGRGQKVKFNLISITKSISNIFKPNFVCILTNERYKTYQTGFSFSHLGHAPGVGLWGYRGVGGSNFFLLNSTKFGVGVTHMNGKCNDTLFGPHPLGALGRGQEVKWH